MTDPAEDLTALANLSEHPGWKLFCAEYAARFASLTREVLDPTKPVMEAEPLRQARGRIETQFQPDSLLEQLTTKTRASAERLAAKLK